MANNSQSFWIAFLTTEIVKYYQVIIYTVRVYEPMKLKDYFLSNSFEIFKSFLHNLVELLGMLIKKWILSIFERCVQLFIGLWRSSVFPASYGPDNNTKTRFLVGNNNLKALAHIKCVLPQNTKFPFRRLIRHNF